MNTYNNYHKRKYTDHTALDTDTPGLREKAKRRASYLIANRDYCSAEMYKKLCENYPPELASEITAELCEYDYINDQRYAAKLAEKLIEVKKYGKKRAAQEMRLKGLDESTVNEALSVYGSEDIREEISGLIEKKYSDMLDDLNDIRRVYAALARRGYGYDDIKYCIRQYIENDCLEDEYYE